MLLQIPSIVTTAAGGTGSATHRCRQSITGSTPSAEVVAATRAQLASASDRSAHDTEVAQLKAAAAAAAQAAADAEALT